MSEYLQDFRVGDTVRVKIQYPTTTDITGYKFWLTLKNAFEDADPGVMQIETTAGDDPLDIPGSGRAYLVATPTDTGSIAPGKYVWDIQAMTADGEITTIAPPIAEYKDKVTVVPGATSATS
jgi:hypothetical protein